MTADAMQAALTGEPWQPPADAGGPFQRCDLAALIANGVPPPELLCRDLLYAGGLHTLAGPPDAGKSTLLCWAALEVSRAGRDAVLLDEESGPELYAEKFTALGATAADMQRIHYYPFPGRTWGADDAAALSALLGRTRPALVGWDSSAAFLASAGLDEDTAGDVGRFWAQVIMPAAREHRAAVVVLDHVTKAGSDSRYARGSGAKLALTDVFYRLEAIKPFSREQDGVLKLTVTKDRRGWLARQQRIHVSTGPGLALAISEADADGEPGGLTAGMPPAHAKLASVLDDTPATVPQLVDRVADKFGHGLRRPTVSKALTALADAGLADRLDQGSGRPALWTRNGAAA